MGLWGEGGAHDPHTHPLTLYSFTILRRKLVLDQGWEISPSPLIFPTQRQVWQLTSPPSHASLALEVAPSPLRLGLSWVEVQATPSVVVLKAAPASLIPWDPGLFFLPGIRTSLHLHVLTPPAAFPVPPLPLPLSCGVNSPAGSGLQCGACLLPESEA